MDDEVVSLFLLRTWTLSSENLKAVVTSVKNFRWIMPWAPERFRKLIISFELVLLIAAKANFIPIIIIIAAASLFEFNYEYFYLMLNCVMDNDILLVLL